MRLAGRHAERAGHGVLPNQPLPSLSVCTRAADAIGLAFVLPQTWQAVGRTRHNKLCYFLGDGVKLKGQLVNVHVDRVHAYTLYGRLID